jgi:hypothetical protein
MLIINHIVDYLSKAGFRLPLAHPARCHIVTPVTFSFIAGFRATLCVFAFYCSCMLPPDRRMYEIREGYS